MKVFYTNITETGHREAIVAGLLWLFGTAGQSDTKTCIIAIPMLRHIEDSHNDIHIALEQFSRGFAKQLAKQREITTEGITIKLVTEKTASYFVKSLILAIYPTKKMLVKLFDYGKISEFFVVPWIIDELVEQLAMVQAVNYSTNEVIGQDGNDIDPVVVEGLKTLSALVNKSTGLGHPSDKRKTKDMFLMLRKAKYELNPEKITTWLVSQGKWNPKHMEEVKNLIIRINKRKTLQIKDSYWKKDLIKTLRER